MFVTFMFIVCTVIFLIGLAKSSAKIAGDGDRKNHQLGMVLLYLLFLIHFVLGLIGVIVWIVWFLFELKNVQGLQSSDFLNGFAQGGFVGGIIGAVIGLIVSIIIFNKMQRTNDEVLRSIDQLTH